MNGLAKSLSVMPGDKVDIEVFAKYLDPNSSNWTDAMANFMASIAAGGGAPGGTVIDGGLPGSLGNGVFPFPGHLLRDGDNGTGPKAYVNYLLFDRDYNMKTGGFKRLSADARETGTNIAHERLFFNSSEIPITEAGYLYIWLSNENATPVEVYFDDFKVTHVKSPVIQSDDYYPFGLQFNSYSRENSVENKRLYNGKELQKELGLTWYDYGWRNYDPQIGRWNQVDPLVDHYEDWSPYNYVQDNPVSRTDPDGRWVNFVVGAIVGAATDYAAQVIVNVAEGKNLSDALTDVDGASIATSAVLGAVTSGASALTNTIGMQAGKQIAKTTTQQVVKQTTKAATVTAVKVKNTLEKGAQKLDKSQTGPGKVPKAERDPKRVPTAKEKKEQLDKQDSKCANCDNKTTEADSRSHHYPKRHADGGTETVQVCKDCHKDLHKKD